MQWMDDVDVPPPQVGWYPTLKCWDSYEGYFPDAHYWDGSRWQDTDLTNDASRDPIVMFLPVMSSNQADAELLADLHDPMW